MRKQLYLGHKMPTRERMEPVTNNDRLIPKPFGGLWTSTWDAQRRMSDWLEWCFDNMPDWTKPGWLLTPTGNARIYTINGVGDLKRLCERYVSDERRWEMRQYEAMCNMYPPLDFEAMATDYDAIHLTRSGERATRFSTPSLYGWDCESTLWMRWTFTAVEPVTIATLEEHEAEYEAVNE